MYSFKNKSRVNYTLPNPSKTIIKFCIQQLDFSDYDNDGQRIYENDMTTDMMKTIYNEMYYHHPITHISFLDYWIKHHKLKEDMIDIIYHYIFDYDDTYDYSIETHFKIGSLSYYIRYDYNDYYDEYTELIDIIDVDSIELIPSWETYAKIKKNIKY